MAERLAHDGIRVERLDEVEQALALVATAEDHDDLDVLLRIPALAVQDGHAAVHLLVDGIGNLLVALGHDEELYRLAGMYHTCIVFALHHIPNGLKIRGHIGSETHRKAAGILSVEKDDNPSFSVIKAVKVRDGSALDMPMTLITWSKESKMFVSAGHKSAEYVKNEKIEKLRKAATVIFKNTPKI